MTDLDLPALREAVAVLQLPLRAYETDAFHRWVEAEKLILNAAPALLDEVERVRKEPCACACHSVGGHTDEPTMGMALMDMTRRCLKAEADLAAAREVLRALENKCVVSESAYVQQIEADISALKARWEDFADDLELLAQRHTCPCAADVFQHLRELMTAWAAKEQA